MPHSERRGETSDGNNFGSDGLTALEGLHAGVATELAERLQLQRPLAFFDLETTGTKVTSDRIVEIAVLKLFPDGAADIRTQRLNPGVPIPAEATAVHGMTDEDVRDEPGFSAFAPALLDLLDDCDLAGFGVAGFDIKLLEAEFGRAGIEFHWRDRSIVDECRSSSTANRGTCLPRSASTLDKVASAAGLKLAAPVAKAVLEALSERDESAEICHDSKGKPEPDPEFRDTENVPLSEAVDDYAAREVLPHVSDAWINRSVRDEKDGEVGKVGYEINFNRYFYKYQPPRPLEEIEADIKAEKEIMAMFAEVTG